MGNFIAVFFTATLLQNRLFFRIAPPCRTSLSHCLCRIVTVQFLNHFLSVKYYSTSQALNCWLNFSDISTYLKGNTFDVYLF